MWDGPGEVQVGGGGGAGERGISGCTHVGIILYTAAAAGLTITTDVPHAHRTALHLIAPHPTSPHLTSPHLTSPHLSSPHPT